MQWRSADALRDGERPGLRAPQSPGACVAQSGLCCELTSRVCDHVSIKLSFRWARAPLVGVRPPGRARLLCRRDRPLWAQRGGGRGGAAGVLCGNWVALCSLCRTSRRTGCHHSSSTRQLPRWRAPSSKSPFSSSLRAQLCLKSAPQGNLPVRLIPRFWRDTDGHASLPVLRPLLCLMSGVGAEPLQAHVLHVLRTQTPRESRRGAAGPWSWGFRGDPALSHTPLQDAGWGGLGQHRAELQRHVRLSSRAEGLGAERQETGRSLRQTQLLLGVQTWEGPQDPVGRESGPQGLAR